MAKDNKASRVTFRLTDSERDAFERRAERLGISISQLLRREVISRTLKRKTAKVR